MKDVAGQVSELQQIQRKRRWHGRSDKTPHDPLDKQPPDVGGRVRIKYKIIVPSSICICPEEGKTLHILIVKYLWSDI